MNEKLKILEVSRLFDNVKYEVPIYQRNYAWGENQIQQLIDDIYDSNDTYFLGNLIVNQKNTDVYEVIDGQQRLTTLYLLEKYLKMDIFNGSLCFEAREKSNHTLSNIGTEKGSNLLDELQSEEINRGYKIIEDYFNSKMINDKDFKKKLDNVQLIRIQVPQDIDLNHYFEIMNTRGEQLELHEIAKAKLLSKLSTDEDKKAGALIWETCSNMNSYVQMNFNLQIRKSLFTKDWSRLKEEVSDFDKVKEKIIIGEDYNLHNCSRTLIEILENPQIHKNNSSKDSEENERFESIISFPNFILQVNKTISEENENESMLDDKNFLKNIESNWESEETAKKFNFNKAIFPGTQGGPLMHVIAAKAVCFKEALSDDFKIYAQGVIDNAQALCSGLTKRGIRIVSGKTENHLMLVDLTNLGKTGKEAENLLDEVNITCNKNTIPNDPKSAFVTSGVRLGTAAVTSRGMNTEDMDVIAEAIAIVLKEEENAAKRAKALVKGLTEKYPLI